MYVPVFPSTIYAPHADPFTKKRCYADRSLDCNERFRVYVNDEGFYEMYQAVSPPRVYRLHADDPVVPATFYRRPNAGDKILAMLAAFKVGWDAYFK